MGLPIWVYDYKAKRYVVFPFHLLRTFPDGRRGIKGDGMTVEEGNLIRKYPHLFEKEVLSDLGYLGAFLWNFNMYFKDIKPTKATGRGAKWYSRDDSQIKKYKRER